MNRAPLHLVIALALPFVGGFGPCSSPSEDPGKAATAPRVPETKGSQDRGTSAEKRFLKIATWNVEWLNAELMGGTVKRNATDYARLKSYADKLGADVIALSEVDGPRAAARIFDPNHYRFHFSRAGGAQRTGFAYKADLSVTLHPDVESLAAGGLRSGTDLTVGTGAKSIRLLAVHLKSGCFTQPLSAGKACKKFARQVPLVEAWIDQRAREGVAFAILGDFNRALFQNEKDDVIWDEWNDNDPLGLVLWSPTSKETSKCWNGKHPHFIDHLVLDSRARGRFRADSFKEHLFNPSQSAHRRQLSDHCALSAELSWTGEYGTSPSPKPKTLAPHSPAVVAPAPDKPSANDELPIKGNVTRDGRKLYHAPECPSYEETRIDETKGERFFANRELAEAAGFARAGNCPPLSAP